MNYQKKKSIKIIKWQKDRKLREMNQNERSYQNAPLASCRRSKAFVSSQKSFNQAESNRKLINF